MYQENEVVMLILGIIVFIFSLINYKRLSLIEDFKIIYLAFLGFFLCSLITVLEGFFLSDLLNLLEHVGYGLTAVIVLIWVVKVFLIKKETK